MVVEHQVVVAVVEAVEAEVAVVALVHQQKQQKLQQFYVMTMHFVKIPKLMRFSIRLTERPMLLKKTNIID